MVLGVWTQRYEEVIFRFLTWVFPNIGVPQNGWFIMENPIKMDDLGGPPLFLETPTLQKAKSLEYPTHFFSSQ